MAQLESPAYRETQIGNTASPEDNPPFSWLDPDQMPAKDPGDSKSDLPRVAYTAIPEGPDFSTSPNRFRISDSRTMPIPKHRRTHILWAVNPIAFTNRKGGVVFNLTLRIFAATHPLRPTVPEKNPLNYRYPHPPNVAEGREFRKNNSNVGNFQPLP